MSDIWQDILNNAPELWQVLGAIIGTVLLVLFGVGASALAGTKALEYLKLLRDEILGHQDDILEAVNEPTDKIPTEFARIIPGTWDTPAMWSALFTAALQIMLKQQQDKEPPQEVNIGGAPK